MRAFDEVSSELGATPVCPVKGIGGGVVTRHNKIRLPLFNDVFEGRNGERREFKRLGHRAKLAKLVMLGTDGGNKTPCRGESLDDAKRKDPWLSDDDQDALHSQLSPVTSRARRGGAAFDDHGAR